MDNNDSSKSPQTGGLKLMTVFIAVLALHVIVIGGFTVYHLMSGGSTDADIVTLDKTHKDIKGGDVAATTVTDGTQPDKTAGASATATDVATTSTANPPATTPASTPAPIQGVTSMPAATPAPAPDNAVAGDAGASAATPAPEPVPAPAKIVSAPAPTPMQTPPPALTLAPSNNFAQNPAVSSLAPPADGAQPSAAPAPLTLATPAPLAGPVHMPPASVAPSVSHVEHAEHAEHASGEIYTVKITDSYKKIAKAHHVTVAELKEANHIHDNVLHTGQKLIIPSAKTLVAKSEKSEKSEKPETSSLSAAPTTSLLSQAPAIHTAVFTSTTTTDVTPHERTYTIEKGDTLTKIAHKFKTTTSAIMAENNISNPTRLTIGKKLRIPSRESRSASIASPVTTPAEPSEVKSEAPQPVESIRPTPPVEQPAQDTQPAGDLATFTP